jgi:AraC-like DNA-binding protein
VRLLPDAEPGVWRLAVSLHDLDESVSNYHVTFFTVAPASQELLAAHRGRWVALTVFALLLLGSLAAWRYVVRRRRLVAEASLSALQPEKPLTGPQADFQRIVDYINNHLPEEITVEKLRQDLKFSHGSFYAVMQESSAASLPKLLNELRIARAKQLLKETDKTVSEIGYETGYSEPNYFIKVFKAQTGLTPREFKKGPEQNG